MNKIEQNNNHDKGPSKDRYLCPRTGAHFEFKDVCKRIEKMHVKRKEEYGDSLEVTRRSSPLEEILEEGRDKSYINS